MHPRPDWFKQFKYALLRLIVCTGVATFTYSGYLIPIVLDRIRDDFPYIPTNAVVTLSILCLAALTVFAGCLFLLAWLYLFVKMEDKISCGVFAVIHIELAFVSIMSALHSGPIGMGQFWDIVGQCYLWLIALLYGLLAIGMALYWLALVWLDNDAQSSGGTADGQPLAMVVIPGKSTTSGTHGTRAVPGTAATPGSTAASSAT